MGSKWRRHFVLQTKSLRNLHFLKRNAHTSNLFKNLNVLKLPDKVTCKYFNQSLPNTFKNWSTLATASHTHNNNRWLDSGFIKIPPHNTKLYGRSSVIISAIYTWNYLQKIHVNILLYQLPLTKLKNLVRNTMLLIIINNLSYIMYLRTFGCFIIKSFYSVILIRFCDLFFPGNSPFWPYYLGIVLWVLN